MFCAIVFVYGVPVSIYLYIVYKTVAYKLQPQQQPHVIDTQT